MLLRSSLAVQVRSLVLTSTLALLATSTVLAQFVPLAPFQGGRQGDIGRLLEPPRGLLQNVQAAEAAIEQGNYGEAVVALGEILLRHDRSSLGDSGPLEDYFLPAPTAQFSAPRTAAASADPPQTLIQEVRRVLSSMPREGLETYELQYGAAARQHLDRAAEATDWETVQMVRRCYFHTTAGRDATALLAQRAVTQGRAMEAERLLTSLRQHWALRADQAVGVEILLHGVQRLSGSAIRQPEVPPEPTAFDDPAQLVPAERPTIQFHFDGQPVSIADYRPPGTAPRVAIEDDPLDSWLRGPFPGLKRRASAHPPRDVLLPWTAASATAPAAPSGPPQGQLPLSRPRWEVRSTAKLSEERVLRESQAAMAAAGQAMPPSAVPLKVGNQLLMRGTDRFYGIDYSTGKLIWQHPWSDTGNQSPALANLPMFQLDEASEQSLLRQRVWSDGPYGRFSSDGQRVFLISDLQPLEVLAYNAFISAQQGAANVLPTSSLVALELATEGKLLWRIGGDVQGEDDWTETFFLGAPLPLGDSLYLIAEIGSEIHLVCLDSQTGRQRWRQQLLAVESNRLSLDPIRRIAGATPSYSQGLLICPTGAGVVVAVDLADRSLAWASPLQRDESLSPQMGRREILSQDQYLQRWWDGTAQIVGRTCYLTAVESNRFYALDLLTGEQRFPAPPRLLSGSDGVAGSLRYLAGVWGDTAVLIGDDLAAGYDAASGTLRWATENLLELGELISGVGVYGTAADPAADGRLVPAYFLPTTRQRIVVIAVDDGRRLGSRDLQYPAGNLIAVDGQIVSQSPTGLAIAHGQRALLPLVQAALENDPNDFQAIVRQAELALQDGQIEQALQWLQQARKLKPDDVGVENLSVQAMLSLLASNYQDHESLVQPLQQLIYSRSDRTELLCLQVQALLDQQQPVEAARRLQDLSALLEQEPEVAQVERVDADDSLHRVAIDTWIAARASQAWEIADDGQRSQISDLLKPTIDPRHLLRQRPALKRWYRHFGLMGGTEEVGSTLVHTYGSKERLQAERLVMSMAGTTKLDGADLPLPLRQVIQDIYLSSGFHTEALQLAEAAEAAAATATDESPSEEAAPIQNRAAIEKRASVQSVKAEIERLQAIRWRRFGDGGQRLRPWSPDDRWGSYFAPHLTAEYSRVRAGANRAASGRIRSIQGATFQGWQLVSEPAAPLGLRDPYGTTLPIAIDTRFARRDEVIHQAAISGGMMIALLPNEIIGVNLFTVMGGYRDAALWRRPWRSGGGGSGLRARSQSTRFGDQNYRFMLSGNSESNRVREVVLGPIAGDEFYLMQGHELAAWDLISAEPRWRTTNTPGAGPILQSGDRVAVVSPPTDEIVLYDRRDGRRLTSKPLGNQQLWTATDDRLLLYQDDGNGNRTMTLWDPFTDQTLLSHTFADLSATNQVFGRIAQSRYAVTLSTQGDLLIWDLTAGQQVAAAELGPIDDLDGLHVLLRPESLLVLPNVARSPSGREGVRPQTASGQDHVRVDHLIANVSLTDGQLLWSHALEDEPWGCTLSQASASPLLILSRGHTQFQTTSSSTRTVDVKAIDLRTGDTQQSLKLPVESIGSEIETTLLPQPEEQLLVVAIGNALRMEYRFSDTPTEQAGPIEPLPADGDGGSDGDQAISPLSRDRIIELLEVIESEELELEMLERLAPDTPLGVPVERLPLRDAPME